jgi:hypothetical protein
MRERDNEKLSERIADARGRREPKKSKHLWRFFFTQPVTVHQCQHCGCEMVNLDATIYLAETERRWNVPLLFAHGAI